MLIIYLFTELATTGVLSTGQAAQQKAIRTLLRRVDKQTQGFDQTTFSFKAFI